MFIDRIDINVKEFFNKLESEGLVEYNYWNKDKDIATILDSFSGAYLYQLVKGGEGLEKTEKYIDQRIESDWKEYKNFINYLRKDIRQLMDVFGEKIENTELVNEKILSVKLYVRENFQILDSNGNRVYDSNKVNDYIKRKKDEERKQLLEQKNNLEQQKAESVNQDNGMTRKLVPNTTPQNSTNKNGFTNVLILSIITSGFVVLVALLTSLFIK